MSEKNQNEAKPEANAPPVRVDPPLFVPAPRVSPRKAEPVFAPAVQPPVPMAAPTPAQAQAPSVTPAPPRQKIFASNAAQAAQSSPLPEAIAHIAELAAHKDVELPLSIGVLGSPGSGKSFALGRLLQRIGLLSAGANAGASPYAPRIFTFRTDATSLEGDAGLSLASQVHQQLSRTYPGVANEAALSARDPQIALADATQLYDESRRRLESERQNLSDLEARSAKLIESVLYSIPGTQIDAYARANRAKMEPRLKGFGFSGDPLATFKDLVRDLAETKGLLDRIGAATRALWAFQGQIKLLVFAGLLLMLASFLGLVVAEKLTWVGWAKGLGEQLGAMATSLSNQTGWFLGAKTLAKWGAYGLVALNIARAFRFMQPLLHGVKLLESDMDARRKDVEDTLAHQAHRVTQLTAETDNLARRKQEAQKRAPAAARNMASLEDVPFASENDGWRKTQAARHYFSALAHHLQNPNDKDANLPRRLVIGLDNLDALEPGRAREVLNAVHSALRAPAFVLLIAADPARLVAAGETAERLEKFFDVPCNVLALGEDIDHSGLVLNLLGHKTQQAIPPSLDTAKSVFDTGVTVPEASLLARLAPLAGRTPRAALRFVNLYRLARAKDTRDFAPLAFALAVDIGGSAQEIAEFEKALRSTQRRNEVQLDTTSLRLIHALAETRAAHGGPLDAETLDHAWHIARLYSLRS